jgi:hypothetical protein
LHRAPVVQDAQRSTSNPPPPPPQQQRPAADASPSSGSPFAAPSVQAARQPSPPAPLASPPPALQQPRPGAADAPPAPVYPAAGGAADGPPASVYPAARQPPPIDGYVVKSYEQIKREFDAAPGPPSKARRSRVLGFRVCRGAGAGVKGSWGRIEDLEMLSQTNLRQAAAARQAIF